MGESVKIAYLCDGLDKCSDGVMCYRLGKPGCDCRNTFNPEHAAYGKCEDPENHPERFHKLDAPGEDGDVYWEGEIYIPYPNSTFLSGDVVK